MNTLHIKKGDTVVVLSGNEKGKTGKVTAVFPKTGMVLVEGVGMHKKHQKPRREGQQGQVVEKQHPIAASKVMLAAAHKDRLSAQAGSKKAAKTK
jgi:large subunit ribosomal protein L24